ncbi:rcsF protein [Thalassotalea euphylliae]|uniref:RcsF protein n=1 Tax=Thalassotalea euphylliae TaxID=1655234 RepID=A0A3E0TQC4_9GAMM|nr:Rcs stress response system protein RcsF [Thalassotalea euphylliae]REL26540.1 rcsF protein [Thalassotalea euphylliae]
MSIKHLTANQVLAYLGMTSCALLLSSCAKISTVHTNLDRENFSHYFSPGEVTIFDNEQAFPGKYQMIGMVEGEHCQAKAHLAPPDKIEARTQARRNAYQLGANAIVFSGCAEVTHQQIESRQCHASIVCYGKAYQVENIQ